MRKKARFIDLPTLLVVLISALFVVMAQDSIAKEIHIGCAAALTGKLSPEGKQLYRGTELWKKFVNEHGGIKVGGEKYDVKITFYDDKSDAATGTKLTEKLITDDKVQFLFGPFSSGITFATTSIGEKYKMITIAPLANAPNIYERGFRYVFAILPPAPKLAQPIFDVAAKQNPKPKTVGIIAANDLYPIAAAQGAKERAEQLGMQVVLFEKYPADTTDVTTLLTMAKDKKPDVFLTAGYNKDVLMVIRQSREIDFNVKMMGFTTGVMIPEFLKSAGSEGEYVYEGEWWIPELKGKDNVFGTTENFVKLYKATHQELPDYHASAGAAAGVLLQTAIQKAGSLETEAVRRALTSLDLQLSCFPGIKFNEKGQNISSEHPVIQVQNQKYIMVYPPNNPAIYPMPTWSERKQKGK